MCCVPTSQVGDYVSASSVNGQVAVDYVEVNGEPEVDANNLAEVIRTLNEDDSVTSIAVRMTHWLRLYKIPNNLDKSNLNKKSN